MEKSLVDDKLGPSAADERVAYVRATVVRASRPASVQVGATARISSAGEIEGFVGGHCAEPSVRLHALRVLETGEPLLLRIEPGDGDSEPSEGAITVHNPCISGGALEIFLEPHLPAPRLHVVGDTPIARALAALGPGVGFDVVRANGDLRPEPDDAAVVVASHGSDEEPVLEAALEAGIDYVGLVASPRRGAAVLAGLEAPDADRVHTPAGLDIGARTPEEIALSILAELVSTRRHHLTPPLPVVEEHHGHHCHE